MAQDRRPAVPGAERPTEMGRYRFKKGGPTPIAPPLTKMAPSARLLRPAAGAALIPPPWPCPGSDAADWPVSWGGAGDWRAAGGAGRGGRRDGARGALGARRALPSAISGSCPIAFPALLLPGRAPGHAVRARAGPAELVAAFPSGEAA